MKILDFFNIKSPKQNLPLAWDTLHIAQQNIRAARCLWKNDYFPEAVFFLEQSVEKGVKAYGFYSGTIDEEFARKHMSHQITLFYAHAAHYYKERFVSFQTNFPLVNLNELIIRLEIPAFSELFQKMDEIISKLDQLAIKKRNQLSSEEYVSELKKLTTHQNSEDQINIIFHDESMIHSLVDLFRQQSDQEKWKLLKNLKYSIHDFKGRLRIFTQYGKMVKTASDEDIRQFLAFLFYQNYSLSSLLGLAIITQSHESISRYPDSRKKFTPLNYYTKDLPLIQDFPRLCEITERNLGLLERLFTDFGEGWSAP